MGKKWIDLYNLTATYESDVESITSDFDFFIENISRNYIKNEGTVTLEMRVSLDDGITWEQWSDITNNHRPMFDGNGYPLTDVKFQYRVTLNVPLGKTPPVFDSFKMELLGAYKIINYGDVICKPEIWIKKKNSMGNVKITNHTNNTLMEFVNLSKDEEVYIDSEHEDIVSSIPLAYRHNNHNGVYLELEIGENLLSGEGDFDIDMRYQFKTLQG